jgi:hypothetical protein
VPSAAHHKAHLAAVTRHHPDRPELRAAAKRDLAAANIAAYIEKVVAEAPPLSNEQREKLALLLRGTSS